ncbi:MGMT family protein [Endozoicomonas sp. 8E]|uniref:MGMT family protein n=1 Tax=Endozoicomonas sp. 8E TaxID=3035692 RepID=UPI002939483F|nr:MGMT family protein [Endozoicomonas sp. 8E]WOG26782.1 MGMT family protein [Endozoicomonas sp. 8E]
MQAPFSPSDIWLILTKIPEGKVVTYGQLANMAGAPGYARVVGNIMKQLPSGSGLPWHRVINSKGQISFPVTSAKYQQQQSLLESEGITFLNGKVNLKLHQWSGD